MESRYQKRQAEQGHRHLTTCCNVNACPAMDVPYLPRKVNVIMHVHFKNYILIELVEKFNWFGLTCCSPANLSICKCLLSFRNGSKYYWDRRSRSQELLTLLLISRPTTFLSWEDGISMNMLPDTTIRWI